MKKTLLSSTFFCLLLLFPFTPVLSQKVAVYSYPIEIELTNDQGDMAPKDYLKTYGTKGKKQGTEKMYQVLTPFLYAQLKKSGMEILTVDTLSPVKSNSYGQPSATLGKAIASGLAEQYMKVYIKDITIPVVSGFTQQDGNAQQKKIVKIQCRIQLYDVNKKLLKESEGIFQSGEKIDNPAELGVDFRKHEGSDYLQELKIYETCCKVSIIKAINQLTQ